MNMNINFITNKIKNEATLFIHDKEKDNECCLCLEKLNNKICYECKNCRKSFCLKNKFCLGILEHLKYKTTCPNCIQCFIKIEKEYELKNSLKKINYNIENIRNELTNDILKHLNFINIVFDDE